MTFSIVIPVYNVAPYLRECLDSVLAQTYADWEAICVDDGSTDGSGAILDEYAAKDGRIRVVHKENEGVSVARNVGISQAVGKWIGFVDADDVISKCWLEKAAGVMRTHGFDAVRMSYAIWNGGSGFDTACDDAACQVKYYESHDAIGDWVMREAFREAFSCLLFINAKLLKENPAICFPPGMKMCEDTIFLLRLLPCLNKVAQCDYKGYCYRVTSGSVTNRRRQLDEVEMVVAMFAKNLDPALANKYADVVTPELLSTFFEWLNGGGKEERKRDQKLTELIATADSLGLIDKRYIPRCYRVSYFALRGLNTLIGFYMIHRLLLVYAKMRKGFLA